MLRDGYVTFKGVLSPKEVEQVRGEIYKFFDKAGRFYDFGKTQPDAFSQVPKIRWLITHPGVLAAVRSAAGTDEIQFTFHSDCHMNMLSGWHTDTGAYFKSDEVAPKDFQVFKVGIYLQDHMVNAQGLTVSEGSHHAPNGILRDRVKALHTQAGDIIVFDVRIWHVGDEKKLFEKVVGKVVRSEPTKYKMGGVFRKFTGRVDKLSVFFTYGLPNNHTLEFSKRNMTRQNKQNGISNSIPPKDLVDLLRQGQVKMVPMEGV